MLRLLTGMKKQEGGQVMLAELTLINLLSSPFTVTGDTVGYIKAIEVRLNFV